MRARRYAVRFAVRSSFTALLALAGAHVLSGCGFMRAYESHHAIAGSSRAMSPYLRACAEPGNLLGMDGFGAVEVSPAVGAHYRPIRFKDGTDSVSVRQGHRVMYAFGDADYFFANVKIEMSDPTAYPRDRETIVRQHRAADIAIRDQRVLNGMEVYGSEKDGLDAGGVIGTYTAFLDREHVVVTAYLLNQGEKRRRFHTMEEYRALRDRFLNGLTTCVVSAAPADSGDSAAR